MNLALPAIVFSAVIYEWPNQPEVQEGYNVNGQITVDGFGNRAQIVDWELNIEGENPIYLSSEEHEVIMDTLPNCGLDASPTGLIFIKDQRCLWDTNVITFGDVITMAVTIPNEYHYIGDNRWNAFNLSGEVLVGINPTVELNILPNKEVVTNPIPVPEPDSFFLLFLGIFALWRKSRGFQTSECGR